MNIAPGYFQKEVAAGAPAWETAPCNSRAATALCKKRNARESARSLLNPAGAFFCYCEESIEVWLLVKRRSIRFQASRLQQSRAKRVYVWIGVSASAESSPEPANLAARTAVTTISVHQDR